MKLFGIILVASLAVGNVRAAEYAAPAAGTNAVVITPELINELVAEARTNNPSLQAADSRARSAALNAEAVRTWDDPMATFGGSIFSARGMDPAQTGDLAYGLQQKLPLWGLPNLSRRAANAETAMSKAETDYRVQDLRREITQGLLATALAGRTVEIDEQDLAWLDVTAQAVESRYRSGQAALADTLQIQNERAERHEMLRADRQMLEHENFQLNRQLNRSLHYAWPRLQLPPVAPAIPFSEKLVSLALANEPGLKIKAQEIKKAQADADLAARKRLPDVSLGVAGRQYSGDGGFREGDFTLNFSLPWWNEGGYRKDYARAKALQQSAEQERADAVLTVQEEVHQQTLDIETARRQALLYDGEIIARATQALASRLADWETGHGTFSDVLAARRALLESELASSRAVAAEHQARAGLLLWTGLDSPAKLDALTNEPAIEHHHDEP